MDFKDLIITPVFFIVLLGMAYAIRPMVSDIKTRRYFIPGLLVKFIGAIAVGMIYQFYYGYGGDTFMYFNRGSKFIWDAFFVDPAIAIDLIFGGDQLTPSNFQFASQIVSFGDPPTYFVVRFAGFFDIFTFHTYSSTALFFASFSFVGIWAMYHTFYRIYPNLHKQLAIAILFMPSVFFWGSGVLKDSLTLGALGLMFYSIFQFIYFKKRNIIHLVIIALSSYMIYTIKIYVLICFIPAIGIWLYWHFQKQIKHVALKVILAPVLVAMTLTLAYFGAVQVGEESKRYSINTILWTAQETAQWNYYVSQRQGGAGYTLGDYDFSTTGMAKKFIPAVFTAMYRPIFWEARNPVMMLSAMENLFILILSIAIISNQAKRMYVLKDPSIMFCLVFAVLFSFSVGISSYNFGALVRYKIPMIPFLMTALIVMHHSKKFNYSYQH